MKRLIIALLLATCALAQMPDNPTGPAIPAGLPPIGAASGALAGTYPAPTLAYSAVNAQTGTTYALLTTDGRADCSVLVTLTNASPIAVSIAAATGAGFPSGWCTTVLNSGVGTATITPTTSTIEGAATLTLITGQSVRIVSNGTNYRAIRGENDAALGKSILTGSGYLTQDAAAGILGLSRFHCSLNAASVGVCTLQGNAASPTTWIVQASAGQGTTDLFQVKNAAGAVIGKIESDAQVTVTNVKAGNSALYDNVVLGSGNAVTWAGTSYWWGTLDASIKRLSSGSLKVGDGSTGWGSLSANNLTAVALATPAAPTVTPTCAADCTETWTYSVEAKAGDGASTIAGSTGTTAAQNATLSASDKNTITWAAVTGATKYTVRRTVSGGTPATTGALATCTAITGLSCVDTGLVGDGIASPNANTTGQLIGKVQTSSATDVCTAGGIWTDASNIYVCTASGAVKKVAIAP